MTGCLLVLAAVTSVLVASCGRTGEAVFNTTPGPANCPREVTRRADELAFYAPPLAAWPHPTDGLKGSRSPEAAALRYFEAIASADVDAFLAVWTPADADYLLSHDARKGGTPKQWKEGWARLFAGYDRVTFVARAVIDEFVAIGYELSPRAESSETMLRRSVVLIEVSDGEWRLTNDLANDPRIFSWIQCRP